MLLVLSANSPNLSILVYKFNIKKSVVLNNAGG